MKVFNFLAVLFGIAASIWGVLELRQEPWVTVSISAEEISAEDAAVLGIALRQGHTNDNDDDESAWRYNIALWNLSKSVLPTPYVVRIDPVVKLHGLVDANAPANSQAIVIEEADYLTLEIVDFPRNACVSLKVDVVNMRHEGGLDLTQLSSDAQTIFTEYVLFGMLIALGLCILGLWIGSFSIIYAVFGAAGFVFTVLMLGAFWIFEFDPRYVAGFFASSILGKCPAL